MRPHNPLKPARLLLLYSILIRSTPLHADTSPPPAPAEPWRPNCESAFAAAKQKIERKWKVQLERLQHCNGPDPHALCFPHKDGMQIDVDIEPNEGQLEKAISVPFPDKDNGWTWFAFDEHGLVTGTYADARGPVFVKFRVTTQSERRLFGERLARPWWRVRKDAVKLLQGAGARCFAGRR